jgi:ABC-type glycerol-3-phosphate transport system permease component
VQQPTEVAVLARPRRRTPRARRPARWTLVSGMGILAASGVFPLYVMLQAAFKTQLDWERQKIGFPTTVSFAAFRHAWTGANIGIYFRNSVVVTVAVLVLTLLVSAMAGYAFSKLHWRGATLTYFAVLAWLAIPPLLLMVPIYVEMVQLKLIDTYWSVILLYTALNLPFNVYLMTAFFRELPDELLEAARLDGARVHGIFARVMLPLAKPALATLVIFNVLFVWNEFAFALLLLQSDSVKTLTVGVLQLQGRVSTDYPTLMAGLLITSLPVVGTYLIFQKYLVQAIAAGALK